MLKRISFALFLISFSLIVKSQTYSGYLVVCDVDDTFKITNTTDRIKSVGNALFSNEIFVGMDDLLSYMNGDHVPLVFLSNSPKTIRWRIEKLLKLHSVGDYELLLRTPGADGITHKISSIQKVLSDYPEYKLILIGDDCENDPMVYDSIRHLYPDRVEAIYIHSVKAKSLPVGVFHFFSPVDIGYYEVCRGRLNPDKIDLLVSEVINSDPMETAPEYFVFDKTLMLDNVAGCFNPHCLAKNKSLEWLIDNYEKR